MIIVRNILFIALAIFASVIVFNYSAPTEAADTPGTVEVKCYGGGNRTPILDVREAVGLKSVDTTYQFIDKRDGHKWKVPHALCTVDYGKVL